MAAKKSSDDGRGCLIVVGLALLVLTLGWPLFAFHRHWTTYRTVNCATYSDAGFLSGCTYDSNNGQWKGTATVGTPHTAISATGWVVEAAWLAMLATPVLLAVGLDKKRKAAEPPGGPLAQHHGL